MTSLRSCYPLINPQIRESIKLILLNIHNPAILYFPDLKKKLRQASKLKFTPFTLFSIQRWQQLLHQTTV